jgi:hypothetical protein
LNKTGTTTLATCLRYLGYRHVGARRDLLRDYRNGIIHTAFSVADRFDSFADWPWPLMFRELYARYSDSARYILTVRNSPPIWIESLKRHSLRTEPGNHSRRLAYGYDYPHGYEEEHIAIYERHNRSVRALFVDRPDLLLEVCWENGDGWAKLCGFLGLPVPDVPFPHSNSADEEERKVGSRFRLENEALIQAQLARLGTANA